MRLGLRSVILEHCSHKGHIAIINAVYPPEPVVSAQMGRDLAVHLVQGGARVTVLCPPPSRPLGADYTALRPNGCPLLRIEDEVEVVRLPSFTAPRSSLLPRMWESWSFGRHVCQYLQQHLQDGDVIYANTWPLLSQVLLARYCVQRNIPLVLHIQDVYPESLLGKVPAFLCRLVAPPLTALDRSASCGAARVVVISENMRRTYVESRGVSPEKVVTVLNWVDEVRFASLPLRREACVRYKVSEAQFTFLYLGNIGPVAGVEFLIEAFHVAQLPNAQLVIAGDGSSKTNCVDLVRRLQVKGVQFISDPEAANVPLIQSLGHVCLLPVRKGAGMSSIPSKLMAYLFSGKPVLSTVDAASDTARCIQEAQCGWVGEPEHIEWLADKMAEVEALPTVELVAMGQRGRCYGLANYSKSVGVKRLADVVIQAGQRGLLGLSRTDVKNGPVSEVRVEPLTASLVSEVVDIHIKAFPSFFLSFLGPRFLREFYASFLADPVGMGFVACEADKKVIGAVVGPLAPSGYFKRLLKRRWWAFCLAGTRAVLRRPSCVARLFRAVFYRGEPPSGPVRALLSSIAVSPTAQGRGVGKKLVERWVEEARKRGAHGCYLTTDAENNDSVNAFYRSLGWKVEATYPTPEGRKMNRYVLDF